MRKNLIFSSLLLANCGLAQLLGENGSSFCQEQTPHPTNITLRHIEANGVGYNQGYTTLEGFFTPVELWKEHWSPFLDLRGHIFNNNKPAANAGVGLRYLASSRVWGMNAYYDYRKTTHHNYNQIAVGAESLGEIWDFRLNGYLPVGAKKSSLFDKRFKQFRGHYAYLVGKYEFAMKGINAEIAAHVNRFENVPLYFAAGPYYLQGHGKTAWGGEARVVIDIFDYFRVEGNTSYDTLFKWIGQGQLSLRLPLGKTTPVKRKKNHSCSLDSILAKRTVQRVDRNEIIPTDHKHRRTKAINPATGRPYVFWFVNNTSHSAGTFESPFNTLLDSQNASSPSDIIYLFPGDGTTLGMDQGITLKNDQKLWGAGTPQLLNTTWGKIQIHPQANGMPQITRTTGSVVICADNNEISGLSLKVPIIHGITCSNITNTSIHNNIFAIDGDATTPSSGVGVFLQDCKGKIDVHSNQFLLLSVVPWGIHLASSAPGTNYVFIGNLFQQVIPTSSTPPILSPSAIEFGLGPRTGAAGAAVRDFGVIFVSNNQFINFGGFKTIGGFGLGGTGQLIFNQNTFVNCNLRFGPPGIVFLRVQQNSNLSMQITRNIWTQTPPTNVRSFYIQTITNTSQVCLSLIDNISDLNPAYTLDNTAGGKITAEIQNNTGAVEQLGFITPGICAL